MANVYKRAGKDGRATWCIRYQESSGKDIRQATKVKTKREAELLLAKAIQEIADGTYEIRQRQREVTFFEICEDFMVYSRAHKRSWDRDQRTLEKLRKFFGDVPCETITRSMAERYVALRKSGEGGLGKEAEPSTINKELACLKTIFRRACLEEKVARNPMLGFKMLTEDNVRDRVISEEEFQRLLFSAPKHLQPVLIIAWETGMRRNEILNLKWDQVDLKMGIIHLHGAGTKSGKSRQVPISPLLKETLNKIPRLGEYVFMYKGSHLRDIRTAFQIACQRGGIEGFWFHDLRHCFVTRMRRKGIPDRVIMAITGHQTLECFRRYDSITVEDLVRAVGGV